MRPIAILPSILSADFSRLGAEISDVMDAGGDLVHVDIMDGHFVPNISFGAAVMASVRKVTDKPFDVHLMIAPADPYIEAFARGGADIITVHVEAGPHVHRSLQTIRALGKKAGIALNPGTDASAISPLLDIVDLVLVMTVNPGFGGQSFIRPMVDKIARVKAMIETRDIDIEVDGGITADNADMAVAAGANYLVAGSSVFKGGKPAYASNIRSLRHAAATAAGLTA